MLTVNPVESLLQLSAGYYVSRALHAVAELGVADALGDAPQPAASLADRIAADAGALDRVLRLLALYGVFEYNDGVVVAHAVVAHAASGSSSVDALAGANVWSARASGRLLVNWARRSGRENRARTARCAAASGDI